MYAQSLFDAELAPLTGTGSKPSASIESVFYVFSTRERTTSPSQLRIVHAIALRAAAEGLSLLTSSGDNPGVSSASDPDLAVVGGGVSVSAVAGDPSYQKGVVPTSMALDRAGQPGRTVPDLSADGDPTTGARLGYIAIHSRGRTNPFTPFTNAGTSMATPVVAGTLADAEQGQPRSFGFHNPLL